VNVDNEAVVRARFYLPKPKSYKWKYKVGDRVRISIHRRPFRKGYMGEWSEEIFEITTRLPTVPVTYKLKDLGDETIKRKFYEAEFQKVLKSDRILKTSKRNGKIQYLVSWKGYPNKFDSWVDELTTES